MKLGLLTAPFPETSLEEVADWTAANGFTTIEIACWPASSGDTRRYAGTSHIDVDGISDAGLRDRRQHDQQGAGDLRARVSTPIPCIPMRSTPGRSSII